jgi:hypothetical protein
MQETIPLEIADPRAAIRYLGEMQSRPMDPIHEPIQNLLDEGAKRIDVELDARKRQIRIRGDARPISSVAEARRILTSICSSKKVGKLGEKGVGMLSFVNVGESMTTLSQKGGRVIWFTLYRDRLAEGQVGRDRGSRLPYGGTEVSIKGVSGKSLKYRFATDRVIKDIKRRWGPLFNKGVQIVVNGRDVAKFTPPLRGDSFARTIRVKELGKGATIRIDLLVLKEPSELASVSITHRGQANFLVSEVPLFQEHNAFTQGMLHGTITGDIAPINASRTGFQESPEFDVWIDRLLDLEEELGKLIEERIRTAAEERDQKMLDAWMDHLRRIFSGTELASTLTSEGEGDEEGWQETRAGEGTSTGGGESGREVGDRARKGGPGRLPTVPYARFTKAPPNIRVVRERKLFRINVNHPDFILATKHSQGRRQYIRELCLHEAYIYSLEGRPKDWYIDRSDEFLRYWTRAIVGKKA